MEIPSFNALIEKSIVDHWDMDALTDYKGATLQYHDVARKIEKLHIMFENSGVVKGDKIALWVAGGTRVQRHYIFLHIKSLPHKRVSFIISFSYSSYLSY